MTGLSTPTPSVRRRRLRRGVGAAVAVAGLTAAGVVVVSTTSAAEGDGVTQAEPSTASITTTVAVEVRDLVETARLSGQLGYESPIWVINRTDGTATSSIKAGVAVERGDELLRIDGQPVLALFGESGAWRPMGARITAGADVRQLEENLSAMGHDPDAKLTIDDTWDAATTASVRRWQRDIGVADDGRIELGHVAFLPGPGQVTRVDVVRGMGVQDGFQLMQYQTRIDVDQVVGHRAGNVTALAPIDAVVAAGDELYAVNTEATYALIGDHVANDRELKKGVADGADVAILEQNLLEMGYDPEAKIKVDRKWDDETTAAVNRWLGALGLEEDGRTRPELFQFVEPDSVVVAHHVAVGDAVADPGVVLDVGRSLRRVTANVGANEQDLVAVGDTVTIVLPDGSTSPGTIIEIATTATETTDGGSEIGLDVEPQDPAGLGVLVEAPVGIEIERRRTDATLSVPTASLVGLVSGGHGVEVVRADGSIQLVAVELGETADGWIQITAGQIAEGDQVVLPR